MLYLFVKKAMEDDGMFPGLDRDEDAFKILQQCQLAGHTHLISKFANWALRTKSARSL